MLLLAETLEFINPLKLHNREFKMLWFEISSERVGRAEFDLSYQSITGKLEWIQGYILDTDIVRQCHGIFK